MSESKRENSISTESNKEFNPSICIASSGNKRDLKCNYNNVHFAFSNEENKSAPELFNSFLNDRQFDAYIFMSKDYDFANENSINEIIEALFSYDSNIEAIYSDILANVNGRQTLLKPQPMASRYLLNNKSILNIPFAVKKHALPYFDESFKYLFLHLGIVDLFQKSLIIHCPKFCFTVNNFSKSSAELNKEMEILKNGNQ